MSKVMRELEDLRFLPLAIIWFQFWCDYGPVCFLADDIK